MAEINVLQVAANAPSAISEILAEEEYHPSYSSEDATFIIVSSDDVKFRVHPLILGMASEIFRDMMIHANDTGDPIRLQERALIVKTLLDLIYPNAKLVRSKDLNFLTIWNLLIAAEKYGFYKILEEFHERAISDTSFSEHPLGAFIIAARYGWLDVLSNSSLGAIDEIASEGDASSLFLTRLDSVYLLKLQKYAKICRSIIRNAIEEEIEKVYAEEVAYLMLADDEEWKTSEYPEALKRIMDSVDSDLKYCPSGKSLRKIWDTSYLEGYIDPERIFRYNRAIDKALRKLPKSVDEISLGSLHEFDG